jgi:hypothetical protein
MSLPSRAVASRFVLRRRQRLGATIRHTGWMLLAGAVLFVGTAGPTWLLWWDTVVPAAMGTAVFALILFIVVIRLPLEAVAYMTLYLERDLAGVPYPGVRFGRFLYRQSGRLDAMAREAGMAPVSAFESPDVLNTREPPVWHRAADALPTVEHLLARVDARAPVHRELRHLHTALRAAATPRRGSTCS